jgi:hypothetical protein
MVNLIYGDLVVMYVTYVMEFHRDVKDFHGDLMEINRDLIDVHVNLMEINRDFIDFHGDLMEFNVISWMFMLIEWNLIVIS